MFAVADVMFLVAKLLISLTKSRMIQQEEAVTSANYTLRCVTLAS